MNTFSKVIFVCNSNTSRSPMAEAIFSEYENKPDIKIMSRGAVVLFPEPTNPKAEKVLNNHGLTMARHTAMPIKDDEIDERTLVLTISEQIKKRIVDDFDNARNVYCLKEFAGETGDVYDPYGGTIDDYEMCYKELDRVVKKTIYRIDKTIM